MTLSLEQELRNKSLMKIAIEVTGQQVACFKNTKKSSRSGFIYTPKKIKGRMLLLENAILSALYSEYRIKENETHLECLKRLRTALSGLCDDSIREIPSGSWDVEYVEKGNEGVLIGIEIL